MNITNPPKLDSIKKSDIDFVLKNGRKLKSNYGSFYLIEKDHVENTAFAVLIKKSVGNAIHRNYCKRIVREFIRKNIRLFYPFKRIIFLYTYSGNVSFTSLSEDFLRSLKDIPRSTGS